MFLADLQQVGDVFRTNNVPLARGRPLESASDNPGDIVAGLTPTACPTGITHIRTRLVMQPLSVEFSVSQGCRDSDRGA